MNGHNTSGMVTSITLLVTSIALMVTLSDVTIAWMAGRYYCFTAHCVTQYMYSIVFHTG